MKALRARGESALADFHELRQDFSLPCCIGRIDVEVLVCITQVSEVNNKQMKSNKSLWVIGVTGIILACCSVTFITALGQTIFQLQPGDIFSLGQLSVELILIPTVIIGFVVTIIQFRETQETAIPRLYWEVNNGSFVESIDLVLPPGNGRARTPRIVIRNEGKAITTWYLIKFEITKDVYLGDAPRINRLMGDVISSPTSDTHWHISTLPEKHIWSFMSNGIYALYPKYTQPLGEIDFEFSIEEKYPDSCTIPFVIYTDKGKEEKGKLKIRFVKEEQS